MSSKKALLASSLTICSASTSWAVGTDKHPVYAAELQNTEPDQDNQQIAQEMIYQYLNPISAVTDGNLAAKVETKPLTYQVKKGDTLYRIGLFYGVHHNQLAAYNQITEPHLLEVGRTLNIPLVRKWVRIKFGDTLESLAKEYKTTTGLLLHLNPSLKDLGITYVGQRVAVPQKLEIPALRYAKGSQAAKKKGRIRLAVKHPARWNAGSYVFRWPVSGQITSNFGWRNGRQHKGIDIWSAAKSKAVIHASLAGKVVQAGYSGGYGNLVVLDHGGGWVTYYAHLSRIRVSKGEIIEAGQALGNMGQTGNATGYHLHFEVRRNGQAINPLSVLK
ncbi:LysM peptidoglycan-binding domain-containing M23 family metallopeptidase [Paenactinomyces guangxiensis]|uniref:M23 family metallopeptidase n=1 Tax=Paenactinomyces guangxiensis TaxID=1490290 RepID=A0A7W1WQ39_9BACL|nr:M23 family metallopeptidase [Paenactinomyces guangxiensis]MBA4494016.1 M23 family metallopeptidase [Paenactinomyces guangxiensis]MBH8591239.1 M23 family metallopeptidase [Paenactinomyces guangxiensis]